MNLSNQEVTLNNGVGAGLKFHGDGSNPDFARGTYGPATGLSKLCTVSKDP